MTVLMDDPTTYLTRNMDDACVILAESVAIASELCRQYGVAIQVNGPDPTKGVRVVTTETEARTVTNTLFSLTKWAYIDGTWPIGAYEILVDYFGPPSRMPDALHVVTVGIAWRPDRMIV